MGREIRRVPPNWQHPRRECHHSLWKGGCDEAKAHGGKCYQPMYDEDAESAFAEWQAEFSKFVGAEHDRIIAEYGETDYPKNEPYRAFCRWHGEPPDPVYYRPRWAEGTATWWQVYQTVSEGSPVTPAFATKEELIEHLVTHDYRPRWAEGTATWWQVCQTVSEGSPVTPAFATKEELIEHLVTHGDDWDQQQGRGGWSRKSAESLVNGGFAFSMTIEDGEIKEARDQDFFTGKGKK